MHSVVLQQAKLDCFVLERSSVFDCCFNFSVRVIIFLESGKSSTISILTIKNNIQRIGLSLISRVLDSYSCNWFCVE